MGARRTAARAAVSAVFLAWAARAAASTVLEPIARLSLQGGYDSNALYEGAGDSVSWVSPDVGLRALDPRWQASAAYGADWIRYQRLAPHGVWNHRLRLKLDARPVERATIGFEGRGGYAYDPVGLALMGIFRTGRQAAWTANAGGKAVYRVTERADARVDAAERLVRFDDGTGGAMHAAGAGLSWRWTERLSVGGEYRLSAFQTFLKAGQQLAFANALDARLDYRVTHFTTVEALVGPAMWSGPGVRALVPDATANLLYADRFDDLRVTLHRGLGIGSTAAPGLVTSVDFGAAHRIGRDWELKADGGIWDSGRAPTGADAVLGYAVSGEASRRFGRGLRIGVAAAHFARLGTASSALTRTTIGLDVAWELEAER